MAAFYANEEEEIWKCTQHPHTSSKRRRCTGICPLCLIDRLSALCPDCAATLPCPCSTTTATSTTSTSSSSVFSLDFLDDEPRISTLIDIEPPFSSSSRRRSSSSSATAFPFFRSARYPTSTTTMNSDTAAPTTSFWSLFRRRKSSAPVPAPAAPMEKMTRSKSVADVAPAAKGKGWYFPSPMKVFRHSKASKVAHQRSPLHRG